MEAVRPPGCTHLHESPRKYFSHAFTEQGERDIRGLYLVARAALPQRFKPAPRGRPPHSGLLISLRAELRGPKKRRE